MAQTNPLSDVQMLENAMKRKEDNCIRKSTSDDIYREKVFRKTNYIKDLVKRKTTSDTRRTAAFDQIRLTIDNDNGAMGRDRVI